MAKTRRKPYPKGRPKPHLVETPLDRAKAHEVVWNQVAPIFAVGRKFTDCPFVYLIGEENEGPIKIGFAKDPIARLRGMQTGNPRRLRVEFVLIGDMPVEKLLHELWEPYAIGSAAKRNRVDAPPGTEWFRAEVRESLLPIIATAADRQADLVADLIQHLVEDVTVTDLEQIVRDAHKEHDFVAKGRDEVRLPGAVMGVYIPRPSRI